MSIYYNSWQLLDVIGKLISCVVTTSIVFQYFDAKYKRTYQSKLLYICWIICCLLANFLLYLLDKPIINIGFWITAITLTGMLFYYDETMNKKKYYLTNIAFMLVYSTCEAVGGVCAEIVILSLNFSQNEFLIEFIFTICGSTAAILLNYLVIKRLFVHGKTAGISAGQYTIYAIITAYVLVNVGEILFLVNHELSNKDYLFLIVDGIFIIFINLYLFYLLDAFVENKDLKYRIALYERQAKSNYDYYAKQVENHRKALAVIHDVRKHMRIVEDYEKMGAYIEKEDYVTSFEEMISPLLMKQYCDNAILNMIINDKQEECEKKEIEFQVDILKIDINFMEPIDITTLFGNILDNAIEACEKSIDKQIHLKISPFNGLIYVQLSNSFEGKIVWDTHGRPLSNKGNEHGIGLENVEKVVHRYNGNIEFLEDGKRFIVEIMMSQP